MEKLIIDRQKWRTGDYDDDNKTGEGDTQLLNDQGYMCCLGFECLRRGLREIDIKNVSAPIDFAETGNYAIIDKLGNMLAGKMHPEWIRSAMYINDAEDTTREEKEKLLQPLFASVGIEVEFIN